jgi:hypothetical protein
LPKEYTTTELYELTIDGAEDWIRQIKAAYIEDPYFRDVLIHLGGLPETEKEKDKERERRRVAHSRQYIMEDDSFITHRDSGALCISNNREIKLRILQEAHDSGVGGHFGDTQTKDAIL